MLKDLCELTLERGPLVREHANLFGSPSILRLDLLHDSPNPLLLLTREALLLCARPFHHVREEPDPLVAQVGIDGPLRARRARRDCRRGGERVDEGRESRGGAELGKKGRGGGSLGCELREEECRLGSEFEGGVCEVVPSGVNITPHVMEHQGAKVIQAAGGLSHLAESVSASSTRRARRSVALPVPSASEWTRGST